MPQRRLQVAVPRATINVTPLVDVMLVLLILFMVATPMARQSLDTSIPRLDKAPAPEPTPGTIVLEVDRGGMTLNGTYLGGTQQLAVRLRDVMAFRSDKTLFVRASGDLAYGSVVEALDVARGSGVERIGLLGGAGPARPSHEN